MNGFLTAAIAPDATCEPGEEWLFHGMAQPHDYGCGISTIGSNDKNLLDRDMDELRKHYEEEEDDEIETNSLGCMSVIMIVVGLIGSMVWAIS